MKKRDLYRNIIIILLFLMIYTIPCIGETIDATLRIYNNTNEEEKFINIKNLEKIKQKILEGGKKQHIARCIMTIRQMNQNHIHFT